MDWDKKLKLVFIRACACNNERRDRKAHVRNEQMTRRRRQYVILCYVLTIARSLLISQNMTKGMLFAN